MEKLIVKYSPNLAGTVKVSKAKNAYLPILAGVLLSDKRITLNEVPDLRDINTMNTLLTNLGVEIEKNDNGTFVYDASKVNSYEATYDLVKTMRASICVLGPLLSRFKKAKVSLPGGCAIGTRPIDLHLKNLEKMGATIEIKSGYVEASTDGLVGANLVLDFPSVGATENLLMAAVFAKGQTVIENAALEPEIDDLAHFLNELGAKVTGIGTKKLVVDGVANLQEANYTAIGDRIEAGTFIMAGLAIGGQVLVEGFNPQHIEFVLDKLKEMGAKLEIGKDFVEVFPSKLKAISIDTAPYPGFPTDLQAQFMAMATQATGATIVTEHIFENRFMHIPELVRLGAEIELKGSSAIVKGPSELTGAPIMCTDLRASAALVMSALMAKGETEVLRVYHLQRGYEKIGQKLAGLGANVEKINPGPNKDH